MSCRFDRVLLVGFEWKERETLTFLQQTIRDVLKIDVHFLTTVPIPSNAYNRLRRQYLASSFLEQLIFFKERPGDIVLGVTQEDIYEPNLNFVFGVALPRYSVAVISTKRLRNSFYGLLEDRELYFRRVATEAIHEIGHILGLGHCPDPHCVMHFSNTLADSDKKGYRFCRRCWEKARQVLCVGYNIKKNLES